MRRDGMHDALSSVSMTDPQCTHINHCDSRLVAATPVVNPLEGPCSIKGFHSGISGSFFKLAQFAFITVFL